jgi:hypothetical protein
MTDEQHCVSFTIPTGNQDNFPIGIPRDGPAWSGRGGGCYVSSGAELCRSCVPPAHQLASLLQSLAWLLYLNGNCCSQFAYDHIITQITISHFVSNNVLLYHEKQHPLWPGLGGAHTPLGIPMRSVICHTAKPE